MKDKRFNECISFAPIILGEEKASMMQIYALTTSV